MRLTRWRSIGLLVGAALVVLSCREPTRPPLDNSPARALLGSLTETVGLLACTPMPAESASATIGPAGGAIDVGPHTLTIPPGALADTVTITAVAPSDTVNRLHFEPTGLRFQRPATVTMSYANCGIAGDVIPKRVAYVSDSLQVLDLLPSLDDFANRRVTGQLQHFSQYAVAW